MRQRDKIGVLALFEICGADRAQKALARTEARAKHLHSACMWELLHMAERQPTLPFIGLK